MVKREDRKGDGKENEKEIGQGEGETEKREKEKEKEINPKQLVTVYGPRRNVTFGKLFASKERLVSQFLLFVAQETNGIAHVAVGTLCLALFAASLTWLAVDAYGT